MAFYRNCIVLLFIAFGIQSSAQDVKFSYQSKIGTSNIDTVLVWGGSFTNSPVSLGAVNLSWVFSSTCLSYTSGNVPTPNSYWSFFRDTWTSLLDFDQLQNIVASYDGNSYDRRVQYGNAISFVPAPIVLPPNSQSPILVMKLWFTGSCTSQVYMEDENENGLNQIADPSGTLLSYVVENGLSQPLASTWSSIRVEQTPAESAMITWTPTAEMGEGIFQIEKSKTPDFGKVENLFSLPFDIEKTEAYSYEDETPYGGLSYYRITYLSVTGQEELSRVVSLYIETEAISDPIRIQPNPSHGEFKVNFLLSDDPVRLQIWDIHGRILFQENHQFTGPYQLSLPGLAAGQYQLIVMGKEGSRWNEKLIIR